MRRGTPATAKIKGKSRSLLSPKPANAPKALAERAEPTYDSYKSAPYAAVSDVIPHVIRYNGRIAYIVLRYARLHLAAEIGGSDVGGFVNIPPPTGQKAPCCWLPCQSKSWY